MKMKRIVFTGLFLISGLTITSAQIKLSFNPEKGKKYEYQTEMIQKVKQSVMGQEIPVEMEMNMTYLMEIKDKTPQEIRMQVTYREVAYILSNPMMKMGYDSKNPVENPSEMDQMLSDIFGVLIDKPFIIVIAPDGSVNSVTGLDAIAESMGNAAGDGQIAVQIAAQLKQQFSDAALKNMFEHSFKIYPTNAVKVGDSWNMESTMVMNNMNANYKARYTLKEVSKNTATIAVDSDIEMEMGEGMEGKLVSTQSGTMLVDIKTGISVSGEVTQNIKGTIKAQGFDIQMDMNNKTKTFIKEVK